MRMLATCFSTAPTVSTSRSAIAELERPSAISASTSSSRAERTSSGPPAFRDEQLRHDLGVERRPARPDAPHGGDEVVDVHDPVLQEVADPAAPVGEELGGVGLLDVLRHDQDPRLGRAVAQRERGPHTLVAERRRQADVDDRDLRPLEQDARDQRRAVRDGRDDVEAVVAQQPGQAVAQQREVLGDHNAQGITALIVVGPPAGLTTTSRPSSASTRRASPRRPLPSAFAPPAPSSVTCTTSALVDVPHVDLDVSGLRVLPGVRERLGGDEVRRRLDCRRRPARQVDRDGRPAAGCARRARQIAAASPRSASTGGWMPRARLRSSSSASRVLAPRLGEELLRRGGIGGELLLGHAEAHAERDEPRLRAVVQVALDPPQLRLLLVDRTGARLLEHRDPLLRAAPREGDGGVQEQGDGESEDRPERPEVALAGHGPDENEEDGEHRCDAEVNREPARIRRCRSSTSTTHACAASGTPSASSDHSGQK